MGKHALSVSTSQRSSMLQCERRWFWSYGLGLEPIKKSEALSFGSLWHDILACFYGAVGDHQSDPKRGACSIDELTTQTGTPISTDVKKIIEWWRKTRKQSSLVAFDGSCALDDQHAAVDEQANLAIDMWEHYKKTWLSGSAGDCGWKILLVERQLWSPLTTPSGRKSTKFVHTGIPDLIVRSPDGEYTVVEHKTTKDRAVSKERELQLSPQTAIYVWLAKQCGVIPKGAPVSVLFNIARKAVPKTPKRTQRGLIERRLITTTVDIFRDALVKNGQDPDEPEYENVLAKISEKEHGNFFHRVTSYMSEYDVKLAAEEAHNDAKKISQLTKLVPGGERSFTRNWSACMAPGRSCQYLQLCKSNYEPRFDFDLHGANVLGFTVKSK